METIGLSIATFVSSLINIFQKVAMSVADRELQKAKIAKYLEVQNASILQTFALQDATENAIEPVLLSNYEQKLQEEQQQQLMNEKLMTMAIAFFILLIIGLATYFLLRKSKA